MLATLVLFVAAGLRFWDLDALPGGLHADLAANLFDMREVLDGARPLFFTRNTGREPLILYLEAVSALVFGVTPLAAKVITAAFGMLDVAATGFAARQAARLAWPADPRASRWTALTAAGLMAGLYWSVHFSRFGLRTAAMPALLALAVGLELRGMRFVLPLPLGEDGRRPGGGVPGGAAGHALTLPSPRGRGSGSLHWLGAGLFLGLALDTYIAGRIAPLAVGLPLVVGLVLERRLAWVGRMALVGVAAVAAAWPLVLFFGRQPALFVGQRGDVFVFSQPDGTPAAGGLVEGVLSTAASFVLRGSPGLAENLPGRPLFEPLGAAAFLVGLVVVVGLFGRRDRGAEPGERAGEAGAGVRAIEVGDEGDAWAARPGGAGGRGAFPVGGPAVGPGEPAASWAAGVRGGAGTWGGRTGGVDGRTRSGVLVATALLGWLAVMSLPSALTVPSPGFVRISGAVAPAVVVSAFGVWAVSRWLLGRVHGRVLAGAMVGGRTSAQVAEPVRAERSHELAARGIPFESAVTGGRGGGRAAVGDGAGLGHPGLASRVAGGAEAAARPDDTSAPAGGDGGLDVLPRLDSADRRAPHLFDSLARVLPVLVVAVACLWTVHDYFGTWRRDYAYEATQAAKADAARWLVAQQPADRTFLAPLWADDFAVEFLTRDHPVGRFGGGGYVLPTDRSRGAVYGFPPEQEADAEGLRAKLPGATLETVHDPTGQHEILRVVRLAPGALPPPATAYQPLEGGIGMVGADFPPRAAPGEHVDVVLRWVATAAPTRDYHAKLQLRRGNDAVAQNDTQPVHDLAPTTTWHPGDLVFDPHPLDLPADLAPGQYTLYAAMYELPSHDHLHLIDAAGHVAPLDEMRLGDVTVGAR